MANGVSGLYKILDMLGCSPFRQRELWDDSIEKPYGQNTGAGLASLRWVARYDSLPETETYCSWATAHMKRLLSYIIRLAPIRQCALYILYICKPARTCTFTGHTCEL